MRFVRTFFESFLKWKIESKGNIRNADVVIALSFGFRSDGPGSSNKIMAAKAYLIAVTNTLPMILQWEVADGLPARPEVLELEIIREHRIKGKYLDTEEALLQMKIIMDKNNWKTAIVFAHPWHIWRVKKQAEKMGIQVIIPRGLENIPFDWRSYQWWTRNKFAWIPREIGVRLFLFFKGKI